MNNTGAIQTGDLLTSLSTSADDYFYDAIVCIAEYNKDGALGFVINRPFPRMLNELAEFAHLPSFPLWEGGPVDAEHLYFIHRRPDLIEDGDRVKPGLYYGGNFVQATAAIEQGKLSDNDIRIFVGYCGWDAGNLEREMEEGGWKLTDDHLFAGSDSF